MTDVQHFQTPIRYRITDTASRIGGLEPPYTIINLETDAMGTVWISNQPGLIQGLAIPLYAGATLTWNMVGDFFARCDAGMSCEILLAKDIGDWTGSPGNLAQDIADALFPVIQSIVSNPKGNVTLVSPYVLRIDTTGEATLTSTLHGFQIGPTAGSNVAMDGNEVQSRLNGAVDIYYINPHGGEVRIGLTPGEVRIGATGVLSAPSGVVVGVTQIFEDGSVVIGNDVTINGDLSCDNFDPITIAGHYMTGNLNMNQYVLYNPLDPTASTHVGDRAYNDARYGLTGSKAPTPHGNADHVGAGFAAFTHGNANHSGTGFMPVDGGTFQGNVGMGDNQLLRNSGADVGGTNQVHSQAFNDARYGMLDRVGGNEWTTLSLHSGRVEVANADFRYGPTRKDSDGAQPTIRTYASGTKYLWEHTSSKKWKRDIQDIDGALLERASKLRPVSYQTMGGATVETAEPGRQSLGLIAEEVAEAFPELCAYDDDGNPCYVAYDLIGVVALAVAQSYEQRIRALEEALCVK